MRDEHTPSRMWTCTQTHALANGKRMQIYSEKPTDHSTSPLHKHYQLLPCQANDIRGQKTSDRLSTVIIPSMTEHTVLNTSFNDSTFFIGTLVLQVDWK